MTRKHSEGQKQLLYKLRRRALRLKLYPDAILREKARPVEIFDYVLEDFVKDMLAVMRAHKGIGLAAPQVGLLLRVIIAEVGNGPVCVINPQITCGVETDTMAEGCLSMPGVHVEVKRSTRMEIRGKDPGGKEIRLEAEGLLARVLQHEADHLEGTLICDYGPPVTPEEFENDLYP